MLRPVSLFVFFIFLSVGSVSSWALELTESFDNLSRRDSSSLIWNSVSGELHPPLFVSDYFNTALADKTFEVGDGRHGAFNESTYSNFASQLDSINKIIYLDTDTYPILQVTSFEIASGWTLRPIGSQALDVRSLSNIVIRGTVNCSGENGQSISAPSSEVRSGGEAHCGGGRGGNGASVSTAPQAGSAGGDIITDGVSPGTDGPTAGGAAAHSGVGIGGGGGGAYQKSGIGFTDSASGGGAGGGSAGQMAPNHDFLVEGGGFGGGGGDYSANSAGGGGGAGGGAIYFFAVGNIDVHAGAQVLAHGGNGGGGDGDGGASGLTAGGGGGGGGGSILMFAGGDVRLAGNVRAEAGVGGDDDGQAGGRGADGRTWLVGSSGFSQSLPPSAFVQEYPDYQLGAVGTVAYRSDSIFEAQSKSFDLLNSKPEFTALNKDQDAPGASQVDVQWASGSTSGFTPTQWNSMDSPWTGERYVKFRVQIDNKNETTPAKLRSMTLYYTPYSQEEFDFAGGCGRVILKAPRADIRFLSVTLLLLPFMFLLLMRKKLKVKSQSKS